MDYRRCNNRWRRSWLSFGRSFGCRLGSETTYRSFPKMSRNILYVIIGVLVLAVSVVGYQLYQERQKTDGVEISIGKKGISIEKD